MGNPPGFDGPDEAGRDPQSSQVGQTLANVGYVLAGLMTYLALKRVPAAVRRSWSAGRDLAHLSTLAREAERLQTWGETVQRNHPAAVERLERAYDKYVKAVEALDPASKRTYGEGERFAASQFVREASAALQFLYGGEARPTLSLAPIDSRKPGEFLFADGGTTGTLDADGVLQESRIRCQDLSANVAARLRAGVRRASPVRQIGRLAWPLLPLGGVSTVGGYYSVEGVRYWLGGREPIRPP